MLSEGNGASADDRGGGEKDPRLLAFVDVLRLSPETFERDAARAGVDVLVRNEARGFRNRARMKAFLPSPHVFALFLYKDAQTPGSDDRFAYGAYVAKGGAPDPAILKACVAYAVSGLHPEKRPAALKRAFPFDVPR
jgi:hypothetical protein